MRLFLSDTFFDAVMQLPKDAQKRVVDFQKKFRQNSTSASLHLEPITQFKDSSLRTARVNDNYRVVVGVMPGGNFSLLYVGDHESAYRWGMNKRFFMERPYTIMPDYYITRGKIHCSSVT